MPRANVNALSTDLFGQFHIVRMIANHEGVTKTYPKILRCLVEKMRIRLDTFTAIRTAVWANVDGGNAQSRFRQTGNHVRVDALDIAKADRAFSDARLVCHDEEQEFVLEPA